MFHFLEKKFISLSDKILKCMCIGIVLEDEDETANFCPVIL